MVCRGQRVPLAWGFYSQSEVRKRASACRIVSEPAYFPSLERLRIVLLWQDTRRCECEVLFDTFSGAIGLWTGDVCSRGNIVAAGIRNLSSAEYVENWI